jgi:hypothetical protein
MRLPTPTRPPVTTSTPGTRPPGHLQAEILLLRLSLTLGITAHGLIITYYTIQAAMHLTWFSVMPVASYGSLLWPLIRKSAAVRTRSAHLLIRICPRGRAMVLVKFTLLLTYYLIQAFALGRLLCLLPATAFLFLTSVTGVKLVTIARRAAKWQRSRQLTQRQNGKGGMSAAA